MDKKVLYMGAFAVFFCFLVSTASAIPQLVNLEGKLNNNVGNPINASVPMTFAIYGAASGGSPLWSETHTSVQINNGIFDVLLGSQTSLNLPFDSDYWLAITVNGENMSQRVRIASAGYAFTAKNADKLNNLSSSAFQKRVSGNCSVGSSIRVINENGTVICENDDVGGADSDWIISGNNMYSNVSGNVGIGTTTPSAKLDVEVPIGGAATIGHSTCSATGNYAIATGYNTNASGSYSTAMGMFTTASGSRSIAMGMFTTASGSYSTAMGRSTTASGLSSTAMGSYTTASGLYSTAMGREIEASGDYSVGISLNNPATTYNVTQDNTMAIMGGNVGIGTTTPSCKLEVNGEICGGCPSGMTKVGSFCMDKYEASVWQYANCTGTQYGVYEAGNDDYPWNDTGNDFEGYGCSKSGVKPSSYITWFQAQQACGNSGKRLCTNAEWQMAAAGTPDACGTSACNCEGVTLNNTGSYTSCKSRWNVYDMNGNLWEWVADWSDPDTWSSGSASSNYGSDYQYPYPAAFIRGGSWGNGANSGVFALSMGSAPSDSLVLGFRCCQ